MSDGRRVLVFDLDDTLYLERDFVRSGFAAAGDWLRDEAGIEGFAPCCQAIFDAGKRTQIFDEVLASFGKDDTLVSALVEIYRRHAPTITLAADARRFLEQKDADCLTAIITDGPAATQMAKVKALGLERMVDRILYTDSWGREFWKPHARAFETIREWSGAEPWQLVYIADNPLKDFVAPKSLGWLTIRVIRPERVHLADAPTPAHDAHARIPDLDALAACLSSFKASI